MRPLSSPARRKRRAALDAALLLVVTLLVVQMWLLTATLESYLAGHTAVAFPALLASLVLLLACAGIYLLVVRLDRAAEPEERRPSTSGPWEI